MINDERRATLGPLLENIYTRFNKPEYIHPDPLELVRRYQDSADQEIAGLIAAVFALGRVAGILKAGEQVLGRFEHLREDLLGIDDAELQRRCGGFLYRFFAEDDLYHLLAGIRDVLELEGSLHAAYLRADHAAAKLGLGRSERALEALSGFVQSIRAQRPIAGIMLSDPAKASASKRLHLYLRWMVRRDEVDPGPWTGVPAYSLIVPMDTHMHRIGVELGVISRKQANVKAAIEVTEAFRRVCPNDPVKFDFSLTRFGIHPELSKKSVIQAAA